MKHNGDNNSEHVSVKSIKTAAHDLNNLLHNALNAVELLKESLGNDLKLFNITTHLEKNVLLASEIVNQLSGKNDISLNNKSKIDLLSIARDVKQIMHQSTNKKFKIEIFNDNSHPLILGYPTEIKRLLINLITNSVEAIDDQAIIQIKINSFSKNGEPNRKYVKLTVSDNGPGIPQESLHNIFKEGFTTKFVSDNRGLGLSIVKNIIEKHSANIEVNSKLNEGTTFSIFFPPEEVIMQKNLEHKKILIAEDDKFQREVLKDLLQSMKINVFTASTGVEALDLFVSTSPDLLFIDETMPEMSGLQCSEKIRELGAISPIVLVTGADIKENEVIGKVSKILRKPYSFNSVKTTLMDLL